MGPAMVTFVAPQGITTLTGWNNQPAATTELYGFTRNRAKFTLSNASDARFFVNVAIAGAGSSTLRVQYSLDQTTWTDLPGTSVATNTTGLNVSTFTTVPAAAKADVFLRVVGQNGDGSADPSYGTMALEAR